MNDEKHAKNKHLIDQKEFNAVKKVLESGNLFRYQKDEGECQAFEREFCDKFGFKSAVLITSGTNALVAALLTLDIGPTDEVIIPAYTYVATASAVLSVGAIPVVVEIDEFLTISLAEIERAITDRTKAIIPVHMDGMQCDIKSIIELAKKNKISVIEDTAQALGAKFDGKYLGTFGDIGCFSLNSEKNLTCGEGGIVATRRKELSEKLMCITDQGFAFNPQNKDFLSAAPFLGQSMRVSEISGAIMRVQLKKLDTIISKYKERKEIFIKELCKHDLKHELLNARDKDGECSSSIYINCKSPDIAMILSKKLLQHSFVVTPISTRNAHAVWKWGDILGENSTTNPRLNAFTKTDRKYSYSKSQFITSVEKMICTIKFDIDITKTIDKIKKDSILFSSIIKNFT